MSAVVPLFLQSSNPLTVIGTADTPVLRWQTDVYYKGGQYLLACFFSPRRNIFIFNLLPPYGILTHLIDGLWIETADDVTTLDDLLSYFFGPDHHPVFDVYPGSREQLPYTYVPHLCAITDINTNMAFGIIIK